MLQNVIKKFNSSLSFEISSEILLVVEASNESTENIYVRKNYENCMKIDFMSFTFLRLLTCVSFILLNLSFYFDIFLFSIYIFAFESFLSLFLQSAPHHTLNTHLLTWRWKNVDDSWKFSSSLKNLKIDRAVDLLMKIFWMHLPLKHIPLFLLNLCFHKSTFPSNILTPWSRI